MFDPRIPFSDWRNMGISDRGVAMSDMVQEFNNWKARVPLKTGQEICEEILAAVKSGDYSLTNGSGGSPNSWQEIWEYSPTGETYRIFQWYSDIQLIQFCKERLGL